jgi:tripartite-type tricarboxylate transporter receptor subunit TctC
MTGLTSLVAILAAAAVAGLTATPSVAQGDPVANFYKGKTVNVFIGVGVGGEYDLQARLVAKYIGRHIPGHPNVVPQNMTGASGLKMLNFLYNQAPRDGTSIGMVQNAFPAAQAIGRPGIQFDANRLNWLGTIAPVVETLVVWHSAGVHSIDDARKKEIVIGATARGGITYTFPALMNDLLGTKFKIVTGYTGGNEINIAMERGEVHGRNNSWSSWKVTRRPWLNDKKIFVIAQGGPRAHDLDAPSLEQLAKNDDERKLVDLILSGAQLGRPMTTNPDVPPERLQALRAAFLAVMKDPEFIAEGASLRIEVNPVSGEAMQNVVANVLTVPKAVAARAKPLLE